MSVCNKCRRPKKITQEMGLVIPCLCPTILDRVIGGLLLAPFYVTAAIAALLSSRGNDDNQA